jgi:hypothetical protein
MLVYERPMKDQPIDEKTREYLKKWGRLEVPTAQITGGKINPGSYRGLATLGWIERRGPVPVVGVHFLLLMRIAFTPMATLSLAMPVTKNTELLINSFLHHVGWDGRVWPYDGDDGWPHKGSDDARNMLGLMMKTIPRIGSTLTFPSEAGEGAPLIELPVIKRTSPYPLAPFEPVSEDKPAPVTHLARFRELCQDPFPFSLSN